MKTDRDDMIAKMARARAQLNAAIERVTPQTEIYPAWKLKQLLDHFAGWDELVTTAFRTHSQGGTPEVVAKYGIDQYNATTVDERKSLTYEQSRKAYDAARIALTQALQEMPAEKLDQRFTAPWGGMCTVSSVVKIWVSHELEHAKQIEEILKNSPQNT